MRVDVLVIDDDLELLSLLERFLLSENPQFKIESTTTAQDAIQLLEKKKFDIIVSDFQLGAGVMNGLELLEWLRSGGNEIPFVMFTGQSREDVAIRALNLGAQFYLRKDDEESFQNLMIELGHHIINSVGSKRVEESLAESESRYRNLYESSMDGVVAVSLDGKLMQCNQRFSEMLGYLRNELIGMNFKEVTPKTWHLMMDEVALEVQHDGKSRIFEQELLTKDGRHIPVAISSWKMETEDGESMGAWVIVRDISLHRMTENVLHENEARFRSLFEDSPIAIALFDSEGSLILANQATLALFGVPNMSEIQEYNLFTDPDMPVQLADELKSGQSISFTREYNFELVQERNLYNTSRSDLVYVEVVGAPIGMSSSGAILGYTLQMQDISEQVQSFELLKKQKEELSQFAQYMKHDITTHLLKMRAFVELLETEFNENDVNRLKQAINDVNELLHHSVELADAGLTIEAKSRVDFDALVKEVARTSFTDVVQYDQDQLPTIQADRTKVAQIFRNLFDNAVIHGQTRRVEVAIQTNSDGHVITVSNDGVKIPKEIRSKIFERGFSTLERHPGYGLNIVKKIVEAHGWSISLSDSVNTIFEIAIPTLVK